MLMQTLAKLNMLCRRQQWLEKQTLPAIPSGLARLRRRAAGEGGAGTVFLQRRALGANDASVPTQTLAKREERWRLWRAGRWRGNGRAFAWWRWRRATLDDIGRGDSQRGRWAVMLLGRTGTCCMQPYSACFWRQRNRKRLLQATCTTRCSAPP